MPMFHATYEAAKHRTRNRWLLLILWLLLFCPVTKAQDLPPSSEIPIERCDLLPVVRVRIDGTDMHFLLDTAATSMLNLKSFSSGRSKEIQITSWSGTAATSAREVLLPELLLGNHKLHDLKLPAIDLSPMGNACGGKIDGILGVDLLDRMGVAIDLIRRVASIGPPPANARKLIVAINRRTCLCRRDCFSGPYSTPAANS